jgi:hypothetical protein
LVGPDTGDGSSGGSGTPGANLMLLAASGAVFLAAGAGVAWRKRRAASE